MAAGFNAMLDVWAVAELLPAWATAQKRASNRAVINPVMSKDRVMGMDRFLELVIISSVG
jgi:hypothetical protein